VLDYYTLTKSQTLSQQSLIIVVLIIITIIIFAVIFSLYYYYSSSSNDVLMEIITIPSTDNRQAKNGSIANTQNIRNIKCTSANGQCAA
jgi:flagellar basal body-associated protein FliL